MIIWINISNMNRTIKTFISLPMAFLLFMGQIHIDEHSSDHIDGYNICNIDCENGDHHFITHECEICIIQNNKIIVQSFFKFSQDNSQRDFFPIVPFHKHLFSNLNTDSRAPPNIM